jgi:hypothetical protein
MMHSGTLISPVVAVVLVGSVRATMWNMQLSEDWESSVR